MRVLTLAGVVATAVVLSSLPRAAAPASVPDLHFAPAPGWTQVTTGTSAIAANVPIHDPPGVAHADETVRNLPATGVVITTFIWIPAYPGEGNFPERSLPLSLADADVRHSFESQPNPDVPEYLLWQRVNGFVLDVRIFFGSQEPAADLLSEAQAELERLSMG